MLRVLLLGVIFFHLRVELQAQVGINTSNPQALLDISVADADFPSVADGILIPRIRNFPEATSGSPQHGMLVFLIADLEHQQSGFYYWNQSLAEWTGLEQAQLELFFLSGTHLPAEGIDSEIYRSGNMGVGASPDGVKLKVQISPEEEEGTRTGIEIVNEHATLNKVTYSMVAVNKTANSARKYGIKNHVTATGNGEHFGIYNETYQKSAKDIYGVYNLVGRTFGVNNKHYGLYSEIGTPLGVGYVYGIYGKATGEEPEKVFAGYFEGRLGIGGSMEEEYIFPATRGEVNQFLVLGEQGKLEWRSFAAVTGNSTSVKKNSQLLVVDKDTRVVELPDTGEFEGSKIVLLGAAGTTFKMFRPQGRQQVLDVIKGKVVTGIRGGERLVLQSNGQDWIVVGN